MDQLGYTRLFKKHIFLQRIYVQQDSRSEELNTVLWTKNLEEIRLGEEKYIHKDDLTSGK